MKKSRTVEVYLYASLYGLEDIRPARPLHELCVAMAGNHYPHVYSSQSGDTHCRHHRLGGEEIWSLYIHIAARLKQYAHIALHYVWPLLHRTARHYLYHNVVLHVSQQFGIIAAVGDESARNEIPVDEKRPLYGIHRSSYNLEMGITPAMAVSARDITFGNVHAADESHSAVDDAELAVVAVVHLACEGREAHGHEWHHLDTGITHTLEEGVVNVPASHIVVDYSHFHSFPRLVYEHVGE